MARSELRGRQMGIYARQSSREQALRPGGMDDQIGSVQKFVKDEGRSKVPDSRIWHEQASGANPRRKQWKAARDWAAQKPGKRVLLLIDWSRWSRDPYYGYAYAIPLKIANNPIYSVLDGMATGTINEPRPDADMIFGIKMIVGAQKVEETRRRTKEKGRQIREEKGRLPAAYTPLYPDAELSPYHALQQVYPVYLAGNMSKAALGREAHRLMGSPKDIKPETLERRIRIKWENLIKKTSEADLENWLDFLEVLRYLEKENGDWVKAHTKTVRGVKKKVKNPLYNPAVDSVRRMSSLYVLEPWNHEQPHPTEISEWFGNPKKYLEE